MPVDPGLETEILAAIDSSLLEVYLSWSDTYSNLDISSEEEFLKIVYMYFRLSYSYGIMHGLQQGDADDLVIPVFQAME